MGGGPALGVLARRGVAGADDGSDLFYGLGASYRFNDNWTVGGEFTVYSMETAAVGTFDATSMSVSLSYSFGD